MKINDIEIQKIRDQFYLAELISKKLAGTLDTESEDLFEAWYNQSNSHKRLFEKIEANGLDIEHLSCYIKSQEYENSNWNKIVKKTSLHKSNIRINRYRHFLRYTAILLLPLSVTAIVGLLNQSKQKTLQSSSDNIAANVIILSSSDGTRQILPIAEHRDDTLNLNDNAYLYNDILKYEDCVSDKITNHTLEIPRGSEYKLALSDGTIIYLNSDSRLEYPTHFVDNQRVVRLEGEGYFEVTPNAKQPFVVEVDDVRIEVLGTSFGIRSYQSEEDILTTLVSGKVKINQDNQELLLKPGWQATFNKINKTLNAEEVDVLEYVAWKDKRIVFNNRSLQFILDELKKIYGFEVFYQKTELQEIPFSLNIKRPLEYSKILDLLAQTEQVEFQIKNNTIVVKPSNL